MKKILIILFSIIVSLGLAFTITWGVINFNKVKDGMSGTGLYTETDLNKAHTDGYNQGIKDKAQYLVLIEEYRNTIAMLNDTVSQLTFQVDTLSSTNKDYETKIESLTAKKIALENEVAELELDKENNEATIYKLNNQIISLNKQISDLSNLTQTASSQITALNNRVNELQSSVNYYESFIAQMENGEQVVATYEVDGTVWKIEILNKGTEITFTSPANTESTIFNGWQVDGTDELLGNTYTINANTKFVANITYKHQVTFMVDEQVYNNQFVFENEFATVPETPTKDGYVFMGWALNRVDVVEDINTTAVNETTTYYAVFAKIHTVTFVVDDEVIATQKVVDGNYASEVEVQTDGTFNGWFVNSTLTDVSTCQIFNDTTFVAKITYKLLTKMTNTTAYYGGSYVWNDGENVYYSYNTSQYIWNKETRTWSTITWNGLTNFDGTDIWTDGTNYYYSDGSKHYILNKGTRTWSTITWNGLTNFNGHYIWTDGTNYYYSNGSSQYVLDKGTRTWSSVAWNGLTNFSRSFVWTDGINCYYSIEDEHYILNKETRTWSSITWNGLTNFEGNHVWTAGEDCYYSEVSVMTYPLNMVTNGIYKLDKSTNTWKSVWFAMGEENYFDALYVWTDGVNYYHSYKTAQYILDLRAL